MAVTVVATDFGNHCDVLIDRGIASTIDRVIVDFPSFAGRFKGMMTFERLEQLVNKFGKLITRLPDHATVTISATGEAQRLLREWFAFEGLDWEIVPETVFASYAPLVRDQRTNNHFITRTDEYTWCATYKKTSNVSWKMNEVAVPTNVVNCFGNYPFPEDALTAVHSYRTRVHIGISAAREDLLWEAQQFATEADRLAFVQYMHGTLIKFDQSGEWLHFPSGIVNAQGITDRQSQAGRNLELYPTTSKHLSTSRVFHLCNWLMQAMTSPGELVYTPFDGLGNLAAAAVVNHRNSIVCELNEGRAATVSKMRDELLGAST
tara:strand:+ start:861 stop:1820 length:960 start_codon:yes stop_codon:yes gene_type:complete